MHYKFFPSLILRTPLYGFGSYNHIDYAKLLGTEQFRTAIFLSSESFFEELERKEFDYNALTEKQQSAVKKYANRASFRSTPFGMFASFSLAGWSTDPDAHILLKERPELYIKPDFSILNAIGASVRRGARAGSARLFPNQSALLSDTDLRYIKRDMQSAEASFTMVAVPRNRLLQSLLRFAKKGASHAEMAAFILERTGAGQHEIEEYLRELEAEQLLVPESFPVITGHDYSKEILRFMTPGDGETARLIELLTEQENPSLKQVRGAAIKLSAYLPQEKRPRSSFYSISERPTTGGGLSLRFQQQIKDGLHCLHVLSEHVPPSDLEQFRKAFAAQYDREEVPLLEALDPQLGIGYGSFGEMSNQVLISSLGLHTLGASRTQKKKNARSLVALLMNEWMQQRELTGVGEVEITREHLRELADKSEPVSLPPSVSVMFRIINGEVVIESAGGTSALQLMGRFSCSPGVLAFAREIAEKEQEVNPSVVFAEIAHFCNIHAANINRRGHLREYEIPVLTLSSLPGHRQIHLSDIMVSVVDDTVVLRSPNIDKPIVPRLGSAYNYTKNSLPVFRFLCDLQSQHLKTAFTLSLSATVPGLKFYPRVRYGSCIIHQAEWHIHEEDLRLLWAAPGKEQSAIFRAMADRIHLPRHVALTIHDNFIVYDLENGSDVEALLMEARNMPAIILKEFPLDQGSLVKTEEGTELLCQYVASLYLDTPSYGKISLSKVKKNTRVQVKDTADWLYFKIYCHPLSADIILLRHLFPLVEKGFRNGSVSQWFWIRYKDPDYHIRVRMKVKKGRQGRMFEAFNTSLNRLYNSKLVHRFQTDVYKRELERYSESLIEYVEALFHCSSNIVTSWLQVNQEEGGGEEATLVEGVAFVNRLLGYFGLSLEEEAAFCKRSFELFYQENGSVKGLRQDAEKLHKTLERQLEEAFLSNEQHRDYGVILQNVHFLKGKIAGGAAPMPTLEGLAADIVHMHINRLFSINQRYYEMLVYFMVYRHLTVRMFRSRSHPGS